MASGRTGSIVCRWSRKLPGGVEAEKAFRRDIDPKKLRRCSRCANSACVRAAPLIRVDRALLFCVAGIGVAHGCCPSGAPLRQSSDQRIRPERARSRSDQHRNAQLALEKLATQGTISSSPLKPCIGAVSGAWKKLGCVYGGRVPFAATANPSPAFARLTQR